MSTFRYHVPLDPGSPWPKFKRDAAGTGRSPIVPERSDVTLEARPWHFKTELGVFSSAVFDGEDNAYIGSGDHLFYCFSPDGSVKWSFRTGEIIDCSALLDDSGRVYVASCDGWVYALDRSDGRELWRRRAHTIPECHENGVNSFVDWFEGHIAIDSRGTLIVPNDNFHTYALDRTTGAVKWRFLTGDQTWSCPAYNPQSDTLFMGTNYFVLRNIFAFSAVDGERRWKRGSLGSMVASPLLTSIGRDGLVVIGGFDGIVRAFKQRNGRRAWTFGCRDHIYGSPVQAADGTIIQPSADGTVYALDAANGKLKWAYDTPEPIRSTPAIDGVGNIYFGNGEGKLYCLSARGELRWSYRCVDDERCDVNGSPALGIGGIVVGADDGSIIRVPYEYPLSPAGRRDERCEVAPSITLPNDGARLFAFSKFGKLQAEPPAWIRGNEPITLSLIVRRGGNTQTALIDGKSVQVDTNPAVPIRTMVSADRRFITIVPKAPWGSAGRVSVSIRGAYRQKPRRFGLKMFGGRREGIFTETLDLSVEPPVEEDYPFTIAAGPGTPASVLEIGRLAPSLPTILPSYNQLGFDSIHYHLGFIEGDARRALLWGVGAKLVGGGQERSVVDPDSAIRFVVAAEFDGGLLTLLSEDGFTLEFNGWDIPYDLFRIASSRENDGFSTGWLTAAVRCDEIAFYGPFLKVLGVSDFRTGMMYVSGGAGRVRDLGVHELPDALRRAPVKVAGGESGSGGTTVTAEIGSPAEGHALGLLLIDAGTGKPVPLNYTKVTAISRSADASTVTVSAKGLSGEYRYYVFADALPLSSGIVSV